MLEMDQLNQEKLKSQQLKKIFFTVYFRFVILRHVQVFLWHAICPTMLTH